MYTLVHCITCSLLFSRHDRGTHGRLRQLCAGESGARRQNWRPGNTASSLDPIFFTSLLPKKNWTVSLKDTHLRGSKETEDYVFEWIKLTTVQNSHYSIINSLLPDVLMIILVSAC